MNRSDLGGNPQHGKHVHSLIFNGSKQPFRKSLMISPRDSHTRRDYSLNEKINKVRKRESRSLLRRSISRSGKDNNKEKHSQSLQRNKSEFILPHNPITNPLNQYNPYAKQAKAQVLNDSQKLYRFS